MPELLFTEKDPTKGYITNNLLIPKSVVNQTAVKQALTFYIGEIADIEEETGNVLSTRPKEVPLWNETKHHLIVPRAFLPHEELEDFGCEWVVERLESLKVTIQDKIVPRDEVQVEALETMWKERGGTVNLACGKGKTILALKYMADRGVPALVVVNTSALAYQWMDKIREFIGDIQIGHIQGEKSKWRGCPITVATVQTLANKRNTYSMEFRRYFGVVFFDEGHHMSAPHFVRAADLFFGERFSLTATATRTDGLESIYQYHLGPIIYQNLEQDLIPDTVFHQFTWTLTEDQDSQKEGVGCRDCQGTVNSGRLCIMLGQVPWRNRIIVENMVKDLNEGRQVLVLTHSVEHTRILHDYYMSLGHLEVPDSRPGVINGPDTKPKDRIPILNECNPVIGVFQLAREALDKDTLDTLHICTPFGNYNDLQQSWGRIQREKKEKMAPRVRVYEDELMRPLASQVARAKRVGTSTTQCTKLRKFLKVIKYPFRRVKEMTNE